MSAEKEPKVTSDMAYEIKGFGSWRIIQCKSFMQTLHLKIQLGASTWWWRSLEYGTEYWNNRVEEIEEND